MSSREKKEIIQNGIFGTIAGFAAGGPVGAITVALAALVAGKMQETKDEKMRSNAWAMEAEYKARLEKNKRERKSRIPMSPDTVESVLKQFHYEVRPEWKLKDKSCYWEDAEPDFVQTEDSMWEDKEAKSEISKICGPSGVHRYVPKARILCDYEKNVVRTTYDYHRHVASVDPFKGNPYVKVVFIPDVDDSMHKYFGNPWGYDGPLVGDGVVYKSSLFLKKLQEDINNPNIEIYFIYRGGNEGIGQKHGGYKKGDIPHYEGHKFNYLYTIDGGKNFVINW